MASAVPKARGDEASREPGPTRRALLALLPAPLVDGKCLTPIDPHFKARWADLIAAIGDQDEAIAHRDGLEQALLRGMKAIGPRSASSTSNTSADDPRSSPVQGFISIGEALAQLMHTLADRHAIWEQGAALIGLSAAEAAQAVATAHVKGAALRLMQQPAVDLAHLRLKLIALLGVHEPVLGSQTETPWRELRLVLGDLDRLCSRDLLVSDRSPPLD